MSGGTFGSTRDGRNLEVIQTSVKRGHEEPDESRGSRPDVRPAKDRAFSRRQTCRGKSQNPVAWIAGWRVTKTLKPIDKTFLGEVRVNRAVTKVNAEVASRMPKSEGRARNRGAKVAWVAEI